MRFNPDQVLALANLERDPDFQKVLGAMRDELADSSRRLLEATDPVQIYREQGGAKLLGQILESAAQAAKKARELQEARTRSAGGHPQTKW